MHRISTCLQIGTANMLHNIPSGRSTCSRISKESYSQHIWKNVHIEAETCESRNEQRESQDSDEEIEDLTHTKIGHRRPSGENDVLNNTHQVNQEIR